MSSLNTTFVASLNLGTRTPLKLSRTMGIFRLHDFIDFQEDTNESQVSTPATEGAALAESWTKDGTVERCYDAVAWIFCWIAMHYYI